MRRPRSQGDIEVIEVDLIEEETPDEFLALLHELALEAEARRARWPADRPIPIYAPTAAHGERRRWHRPASRRAADAH
ncbi:hypothetical protein Q6348_08850 [Isoptericola sp. b441]|uniref:Acetyl-CoA carboxylase biotin carboxyl carrier protein subunit n=1 Tax=Actinotalea lenta TaxID=3064654 RepID=A0ABT9D8S8_9CELL|nr:MULTISPECIES: hypothetical protein [unclassified Isoptericola]MDO8107300.1 hypothetical protein [Isoptericola sp. b441]MDO8121038.1 hypothetical protein [Isoptericola sp. b490]